MGGINLDSELLDMKIKRDGNGIPLPIFEQPIDLININGFLPVIINIIPITQSPMLMGLLNTNGQKSKFPMDPLSKIEEFKLNEQETLSFVI